MAPPKRTPKSRNVLNFFLGFLFAYVLLIAGIWLYFRFGTPPVATADKPFPFEAQIVEVPLNARIQRNLQQPPFPTSEDAYETGAHVYTEFCASCHGVPGENTPYAKYMFPIAPQLWQKHTHNSVVGVSDDDPGETYWKIKNGIRLSGMPSYQNLLSSDQMWDIALLLKNADQQLPDPVTAILTKK